MLDYDATAVNRVLWRKCTIGSPPLSLSLTPGAVFKSSCTHSRRDHKRWNRKKIVSNDRYKTHCATEAQNPSPITRAYRSIKTCCWADYGERCSELFRICFIDTFTARMVRVCFIPPYQLKDFSQIHRHAFRAALL